MNPYFDKSDTPVTLQETDDHKFDNPQVNLDKQVESEPTNCIPDQEAPVNEPAASQNLKEEAGSHATPVVDTVPFWNLEAGKINDLSKMNDGVP